MTGSADIDLLMELDPLGLSTDQLNAVYERVAGLPAAQMTPRNIDQIIEYQRRARAAYGRGEKRASPSASPDLSAAMANMLAPKGKLDRRF